ncbi:MAG: hypothetical protein O3A10_06110 [Chloroflexi bacterium]|nr:hypothetical protein [Chloroflexota bacterium]MDA1145639.1 hypothetical protein [Chloroflexota bacterium]
MSATVERQLRSYMAEAANPDQPNVIHSTVGAQAFGFPDALVPGSIVYGSIVYGWCTPAILEALGPAWLHEGWADVRFRRPVHPDDLLTVRLDPVGDDAWSLEVLRDAEELALVGTLGRGIRGDLIDGFHESPRVPAIPVPDPPPVLTPENIQFGIQLPTYRTALPWPAVPPNEASPRQRLAGVLLDGTAYANPAGVSGRMSWYGHTSYDYAGPSIHTRTQAQHFAPAHVDEPLDIAAFIQDGYARNGHHYIVYDGTVRNAAGDTLAHVRHTVIYRVATRSEDAS